MARPNVPRIVLSAAVLFGLLVASCADGRERPARTSSAQRQQGIVPATLTALQRAMQAELVVRAQEDLWTSIADPKPLEEALRALTVRASLAAGLADLLEAGLNDTEVERAFVDALTLAAKDEAFMALVVDVWR